MHKDIDEVTGTSTEGESIDTSPSKLLLGLVLLAALHVVTRHNYLLFHSVVEVASVVVAGSIFVIAWNARRYHADSFFLVLGTAYLFIGGLDLLHALAYKGMGVFPGHGSNLATQLWIAARYLESASLLAASLIVGRRVRASSVILAYLIVIIVILTAIFPLGAFPDCFIEGVGLTRFKVASEYIIAFILLASLLTLHRRMDVFEPKVVRLLNASIIVTVASEMSFTLYSDVYGILNMLGHYLKIVSFALIYEAIVVTGIRRPYAILFRELRLAQDRLLRKERLSTFGKIAGSVAHDIRNPLGAVSNSAFYLERRIGNKDEKVDKHLTLIRREVERANRIIGELLDFTRERKLSLTECDINALITTLVSDLPIPENINVKKRLANARPAIPVDPDHVRRALENLVTNALQAMSDGGTLTITTTVEEDMVAIILTDTGHGIDKEEKKAIFEPLYTTRAKGIGLGLSIVKDIVDAHSGTIGVESTEGEGAAFTVRLPLNRGPAVG